MIAEIGQGLADRAAAAVGVTSAYPEPPNRLGNLPCAVVYDDPDAMSVVTFGASEMWQAQYLIRIYVAPVRNIPNEIAQARQFFEAFVAALRAQYQLGVAGVYGVGNLRYQPVVAAYGGTDYVCADIRLEVKAKQATEITV